jgi:predicted GIY-YIG superfamily endonuclease
MRDEYIYYVYMMQSTSRRALYIGMTSNMRKRVWQHKNHIREGFCDNYNCHGWFTGKVTTMLCGQSTARNN